MKKEINITVTVDVPEEEQRQDTLSLTEGYMVVDATWKRSLTFHNKQWLGSSSITAPITVFKTVEEAHRAIRSTVTFENGRISKYAWQSNNYIIIGVHKDNRPLRAQQE